MRVGIFLAACLFLLPGAARAQGQADAQFGYVVRVDSASVILDFTERSGAAAGQPFTIFKEGEELKHPATGASLGPLETPVAEGSLREVFSSYSIGIVGSSSEPVAAKMRARLKPMPAAPQGAEQVAKSLGLTVKREPRWRGPAFDYQATALAIGDCLGDGKREAAVSDGRKVYLYPYPPADAKPIAEFAAPGTAPRIYSLEAADLNANGRAELFVSYFNDPFKRFETKVLELDRKGALVQVGELPYLVRGYQDLQGARRMAAQQIQEESSFPFGAIYPLVYQDGKYGPGKPALDFLKHKVDWLYDFTFLTVDHKAATADVTDTELIRVRFSTGSAKTAESYGQTPNRVRWTGDRWLNFRPAMAVRYDDKGFAGLYAVKNIASYGGASAWFGRFASAELRRLDWTGLGLAPSWVAELGGYSTALALTAPANGPQELSVMVVGTAGQSSIWSYEP
jgi:hypothetical protein